MTVDDVARIQGCSARNVRRYCTIGYRGRILPSVMAGNSRSITEEDFQQWREACGFEPLKGPVGAALTNDQPKVDPVVPPVVTELAIVTELAALPINEYDADVYEASDDELLRRVALGCKPDCPTGKPSNVPSIGSSTMPSPYNFKRANEARAELGKREQFNRPRVPQRRQVFYRYKDEQLAQHNLAVANLTKSPYST